MEPRTRYGEIWNKWLAHDRIDEPGAAGFDGGMAVSCGLELARELAVWVPELPERPISRLPEDARVAWVDRGTDGTVATGEGIPAWWSGGAAC